MKKLKSISKNYNLMIIILVLIVISLMTLGFAKYSRILDFSGGIVVKPDGKFEIKSILRSSSSNFDVANSDNPVVVNNVVSFDLVYKKDDMGSDEYYVEYDVNVENNSSYDYLFNSFDFNPVITGLSGGTGEIILTLDGLENGDVISAKSTLNFKVRLTLIPSDPDDTYEVSGDTEMETETEPVGSILIGIKNSPIDLTGSNNRKAVNFEVVSTYKDTITFTPKVNNSSFILTGQNGETLSSMTINGNSTEEYTVYLSKNGDPHFYQDEVTLKLSLQTNLGNFSSSDFKALVDIYVEPDVEAPIVNSISIANSGTEGRINATFSGSDNSNGDITYTLKLYNAANNQQVGSAVTVTSSSTDTQTASFTGISQGTETRSYYAKITAVDASGNTSTEKQSSNISVRWRASVTTHFTSISSNNTETSVLIGSNYKATLSYSGTGTGNVTDNTVKVLMGGTDITSSVYTASSDVINIPEVTGDIDITATGEGGGCLVEGTLITLADGSKKLVEDIDYTDLLKVWDHEKGEYTYVYPIFLENELQSDSYMKTTFSDGTILKTVSYHSVFSVDKLEYVDITNSNDFHIGTKILKDNGNGLEIVTVTNIEMINEKVKYYMIVTTSYYNFFANDILNATGETFLLNMWGYDKDYKFLLDRKMITSDINNYLSYDIVSKFLDYYMYKGLRASDVGFLINNGYIQEENISLIVDYFINLFGVNLRLPKLIDGKRYWMVTTSVDKVTDLNKQEYLYLEGSSYILPDNKEDNFVSWYNTNDSKYYNPGDKVEIWTGTHFVAIYK